MAGEEEKLLIDEEETVQIKDLNKVTTVKNTDLLLLDDGVASSNAITYENFLKTTKDKTFKGEGLGYFKEIIKSTIAEELAADEKFVEKIYANIIDKLIGNDSDKLSNLFSKIKSRLTDSISSATLSKYDNLLIMSSSTIQKTPVPQQLLGVPSGFTNSFSRILKSTLYSGDYENSSVTINMEYENYDNVTIVLHKSDDDTPIYLDIDIYAKFRNDETKSLYLRYVDETEKNIVYRYKGVRGRFFRVPMFKGWYLQKRISISGNPVPRLLKL
ncbi:DUF685 domain-containing protein (plasmid) [Borreliella japonica]|uniref:DUF685 domain-containing protein n=2 Tax=Borreliella TaxID=64895 RepID=UPI003AB55E48